MVRREQHPLNKGKREPHCTGLTDKLYDRHDLLEPIFDSMKLMYYKMGWSVQCPVSNRAVMEVASTYSNKTSNHSLCNGCINKDPGAFSLTADKSHLACGVCGVVSSAIHIATDREKNCARDDDKTTHADKPYELKTDRFDKPAKSCVELRNDREQSVFSSRVSKAAKTKYGLGWGQEHAVRQAARAEQQRQAMDQKDLTKSNHIQQEMDKLFGPLEPIDNNIKRFCRMEADRAWREAVRHCDICTAKSSCQLRIKERGPAVIAEAVFGCSLAKLLDGKTTLEAVSHSGLLTLADRRAGLQNVKGGSSAHRAVQTVVASLLAHDQVTAIPECQPIQQDSLVQSSSKVTVSTPFSRSDSDITDIVEQPGELTQLTNDLIRVHKALGPSVPRNVLDGAMKAVQVYEFRSAMLSDPGTVGALTKMGVAFVILDSVSAKLSGSGFMQAISPRLMGELAPPGVDIERAISVARELLPAQILDQDDSADYLF